jgi:hypothetical protein
MGSKELQRLIDNKSLVALRKFAAAEAQLKELKAKHDEVIEQIRDAMIANNVDKLEGDWGYITLAERTNYKAVDLNEVPREFVELKASLMLDRVKAQDVLSGELPAGVIKTSTQYITKKIKEI